MSKLKIHSKKQKVLKLQRQKRERKIQKTYSNFMYEIIVSQDLEMYRKEHNQNTISKTYNKKNYK